MDIVSIFIWNNQEKVKYLIKSVKKYQVFNFFGISQEAALTANQWLSEGGDLLWKINGELLADVCKLDSGLAKRYILFILLSFQENVNLLSGEWGLAQGKLIFV